jgi:hypothetical protein
VRAIAAVLMLPLLAGCAAEQIWAPDEAVQAARYVHSGPPEIALVTSINDRSGEGAHSALMISGSERVLFDPAGNWDDSRAPERHDVRHGFTPQMQANYFAYQSFGPFHAVVQRITVSPAMAERALQLVKANGAVPPSQCTSATSSILRQLPGFESMPSTLFPRTLMEAFAAVPGVRTEVEFGTPDKEAPDRVPKMSPVIVAAMNRQGGS